MEKLVLDQTMKEIIYYTTNRLEGTLIDQMARLFIAQSGLPIISVSQKPLDFGKNIVYPRVGRSHTLLFNQILTGLKASQAKYVFFCEHDTLYHPSHFEFTPPRDDVVYYNNNALRYRLSDRRIVGFDSAWLSQLVANRELLIKHYETRLEYIKSGKRGFGYEPGSGQSKRIDDLEMEYFESAFPNIDIRHDDCLTGTSRMYLEDFKKKPTNFKVYDINNIPGWSKEDLWI